MKRIVSLMIVLVLILALSLAQFTPAGSVQASDRTSPEPAPSLDEVIEYYGRLADRQGQIGVVVELDSKPASLVYADARSRLSGNNAVKSVTQAHLALVQREQNTFMKALRSTGIDAREIYRTQRAYNGIAMYVEASQVAELAKLPGVKAIHPLIPHEIEHTTSVPLVGALQVWAGLGQYQGQGIKIGIIDSGIDYIHTNFGGPGVYTGQDFATLTEAGNLFPTAKVVGGYDFAGDSYNAGGSGTQLIPAPDGDPMDCNGHGTHVAGTAAGFGALPDGSTYVESGADTYANLVSLSPSAYQSKFRIGPGVAPQAELYALRVFGCSGSTALTTLAIEWAMDPNGDNDFSDHLDVINMSLGSSFGTQYDSSAVAANNAAQAGVIVVASAGNSGDVFYITGAPAVAQRAISVASSQDSSAILSSFEVTTSSNPALVGSYMAGTASFGPQTFNVTGDAVVAAPYRACSALTNAAAVSGKIAVVQRGDCVFAAKVENAQAAGAIGVLLVNNTSGFPPAMGGTPVGPVNIPVMSARDVDGVAIVNELNASGTVTIKLDSSLTFLVLDPSLQDKVSTFTSRGIARGGSYIKPDLTAPGDTIFSAATGTGNRGVSFSGTSMAAPHVAGIMAILRQQRPTWTADELKALVMNTATDDVMNAAGTLPNTPSRIGAGRTNVHRATQSDVIAYNATNPELVSVPFGVVKVAGTQSLVKEITVRNKGTAPETYNAAFVSRYAANAGITFSLLDASDLPLTSLTVPVGGTATIKIKVDLNATALQKTLDPTLALANRSRQGEAGGFVQLTSTGSAPTLRVPVHIAARAASNMEVAEPKLVVPTAGTGTVALTPTGTPVDLGSNDYSLAYVLELVGESPQLASLPVPTVSSADLQYIGAMSNYPTVAAASARVFFGVSTYGEWDTLYSTEFDIYVDINEDNVADYVIYNYDNGGTSRNDTFITIVVNLNTNTAVTSNFVNLSGGTNTNIFNNNIAVLPVGFAQLGLSAANTDFKFYIATFHRDSSALVDISDVYQYDTANKAFSTHNPALSNFPLWYDDVNYSPTFNIGYNTAYITPQTKGLLVLHHHNAVNTAEVVPLSRPTVASITRAIPNPTGAVSVDFTVTFSEAVTGVDETDFAATVTSGALSGASVASVTPVSASVYTVSVNTGTGNGTLRLDLSASGTGIKNAAGTDLLEGFDTGEEYTVDKTTPAAASIARASPNPTDAASVNFTVTFSEAVTGVDETDFAATVTSGALSGAGVASVTPVSASVYTVSVNTGTGNGTLRLDLSASGTGIADTAGNPISGGFDTGEEYTVDKTAPVAASIARASPNPTGAVSVNFTVTFSEAVTGVDETDFAATVTSGALSGASVASVTPVSASVYTVSVNTGTGNGTLRLDLNASGTGIADTAGNPISGGFDTGEEYTVDKISPSVTSIVRHSPVTQVVTSGGSVTFRVTFSKDVTGVDLGDFELTLLSVPGANASINTVTPVSGSVYDVVVNLASLRNANNRPNGAIRLDVASTAIIADAASNSLIGLPFTSGEVYSIVQGQTFGDVTPSHWASTWVERLYYNGITSGCGSGNYCPSAPVTRAQMAIFLLRAKYGPAYTPPAVGGSTGFADVSTGYWAAAWIKQLAVEGITSGCGGGNYCPENPVTRDQMAIFLLRSKHGLGYTPPAVGGSTGFADVPTGHWAAAWIKQLAAEGITSGCGGGNYCPSATANRDQMAIFLVRTFSMP